ncbi:MAG: 4-phosphoerythronate dehydrogenase PdxB [bacterium]|nr:4-phosphoerythronate dehydrogenase PdxB [bacterium]
MKIVVDENIPYGRDAFATLGDVVTMPGRAVDAAALADADMLMVRSITKVNAALLDGTPVRFVATATIGEDHIDKPYLADRGIGFSSAPGCNANSVGQYVTGALLALADAHGLDLTSMKLGIVGVGNVGKRVLAKASALGMECVLNDPPLARTTGDAKYRPIDDIFDCDVVTLHVPLTREGEDATFHLADEAFIARMKPGAILINSSRGPVTDGTALEHALDNGHIKAAVLDVWEDEPRVESSLLRKVFIGTPHIAGYSFDGKVNGTRQIYEAACASLGVEPTWDPSPLLPAPECPEVRVDGNADVTQELRKAVLAVYDIRRDDTAMRTILDAREADRATAFDRLRKEYPRRREFFNTRAIIDPPNETMRSVLSGIGFTREG